MAGRRWTDDEEQFLENHYMEMTDEDIAEEIGRTKAAVMNRRQVLDLDKDGWMKNNWTDEELQILKENYDKPLTEIAEKLPRRNKTAVKKKKSEMGWVTDRTWSDEEEEFLERIYGVWTAEKIADYLSKDRMSVYNKVKRENLSFFEIEEWSQNEVEFLEGNYESLTVRDLAEELDRTESSVRSKKNKLGLTYQGPWSDEDEKFLKDNFPELSDDELAEELDRSIRSVKNRRRRKFGLIRPGMLQDTIWRSWEKLCIQIARELYDDVEVKPELSNGTLPDIRIGEMLVDVKKTPHTHRVDADVRNYSGHCGRLEFWCLFGHRDFDKRDVDVVPFDELRRRVETGVGDDEKAVELMERMEMCFAGVDPF